jgi:beta-barrel assembly-enhancing protease
MLAEAQRSTLPAMAAMLAAILLASSGQKVGDAALAVTTAAVAQKEINFTRAHEEEADRLGTRILADAGFDPRAMPSFFERMQMMNRHNETNLPRLLLTHPVTTARIAESRARAEQYPYRQVPDSFDFHLARAKLRAYAGGDADEIARGFAQNLSEGRGANLDAERYGYAHALLRARRYDAARVEARRLADKAPANVAYQMLLAQIETGAGRADTGLALYAAAYKRSPDYYPLALEYARTLLKTKRSRDAEPIVRDALKTRRTDPALYDLLAQAVGANGKAAEAHQAIAEQRYLKGDPNGAIEQLRLASRHAGDNFYLQSSIEARIQAIKDEAALYQSKNGESRSQNSPGLGR